MSYRLKRLGEVMNMRKSVDLGLRAFLSIFATLRAAWRCPPRPSQRRYQDPRCLVSGRQGRAGDGYGHCDLPAPRPRRPHPVCGDADPDMVNVAELASRYGFTELGCF